MKRAFWLPRSRRRIADEVTEEFRFHIEERIEQFVQGGMSREDAERETRRRFGNYDAFRDLTRRIDEDGMEREQRREWMGTARRELSLAARALGRSKGFTLIALVTLALGIGATTAIFTVLDAVVLRPLGYRQPEQLVAVLHPATVPGSGERKWGLSTGGYFQLRDHNKHFESFAMYQSSGMVVTNGGEAEVVQTTYATASIFQVLRARAFAGRLLDADDDTPGAPRRVVLSYEFWQRRFGGDTAIIGRNLETSSATYEIVGVAEPGLVLPMPGPFASASNLAGFGVDVWRALQANPAGPHWNSHPNVGLGRLKEGSTIEDAQRDVEAIFRTFPQTISNAYSERFITNYNFRIGVTSLRDEVLGPRIPRTLWMLFGAVLLVLLIASANVSNLFLVRHEARRREAAIRAALGASRGQMTAHHLAESMLVCGLAAAIGLALAFAGIRVIVAVAPTDIPRLAQVALGWHSVALALGIGVLLGLVLGLAPLLRGTVDLQVLREGGRGLSASVRQRAVRSGLVVGQVAFAVVLLAVAGLMLRSFNRLRQVEPGFYATNTLVFDLSLPFVDFDTREKAMVFHKELQRKILALPGVESVGGVTSVPLEGYATGCSVVYRENRPYEVGEQAPCVATPIAVPGLFDALRITVRGRKPDWNDADNRTQAVVITKALGDRLWPGEDPIGKGIRTQSEDPTLWYRIVGVVPELRAEAFDRPPTEAVFYAPTWLTPNVNSGDLNDLSYLVRTDGRDPLAVSAEIRALVAQMDRRVPFVDVRSMEAVVRRSMARVSFMATLLALSAGVALLLSAVGLYGVIAYLVAQRRSEIGIRMALGASIRSVVRLVLSQSVTLAAIGVVLGLAGTLATQRVVQSLLFEVSATDPLVLGLVVATLLLIALLASLIPARRAARIDPAEAMRADG